MHRRKDCCQVWQSCKTQQPQFVHTTLSQHPNLGSCRLATDPTVPSSCSETGSDHLAQCQHTTHFLAITILTASHAQTHPVPTKFWAILRQINVPLLSLRSAFNGFISFLFWIGKVQFTCRDVLFETVPFRSVHTMAAGHWNSNRKEHISNQTVGFFANLWLVKVLLRVHEISKWVLGRNSPPDFLPIWRTTFKSDQVSLRSRWQGL